MEPTKAVDIHMNIIGTIRSRLMQRKKRDARRTFFLDSST